jgi:tetratricopeptide (TPR) repeat protein
LFIALLVRKPMHAIRWLTGLFGKRDNRTDEARARDAKVAEGVGYFMEGHKLFNARQDEEALDRFDQALGCGFEHHELLEMRAMCLQRTGYDLDAIEDFDKAIASQPQDCNLYFMRSLSLTAVGRYEEAANGLQEAIRLSRSRALGTQLTMPPRRTRGTLALPHSMKCTCRATKLIWN